MDSSLHGRALQPVVYRPLSDQPASERDVAYVVADGIPAARIADLIRATGGECLEDSSLIDLYRGPQIPEGHRSLTYRLRFRAMNRTLTEGEVNASLQRIADGLATLGVRVR